MADASRPPVAHWDEEFRTILAAGRQRRRRLLIAVLAGASAVPMMASALWRPPTILVWNASASAPIGLYRVQAGAKVRRGDMVIAWVPSSAGTLAAVRHYLPANVPLVKRVVAVEGDRVCAAGRSIRINGRQAAQRRRADSARRPMPWWTGCRRLGPGDYLLLTDDPASFDGRYFGITRRQELVGRAVLLLAKPAKASSHG